MAAPLTLPAPSRWAPPSPTRGEGKVGRAHIPLSPLWEREGPVDWSAAEGDGRVRGEASDR